jgi:hypothetical protein
VNRTPDPSRGGTPRTDDGATAAEYAILVGFIAAVVAGAVTVLGLSVNALFALVPPGVWP